MSAITIHDIDDELNERLTREARRRHTSRIADILSSSEAVILPAVVIGELLGALLLTLDSHFEAVDGLRRYPLPNVT